MSKTELTLFGVSIFIALAWVWIRFLPRIFCREKLFSIEAPIALVGIPDLVMQKLGGELVIHDLKTRKTNKTYSSDILQLALYAYLLRKALNRRVSTHAIIRVKTEKGLFLHQVSLLAFPDSKIEQLYNSFQVKRVNIEACNRNAQPYMCKNCGFYRKDCAGSTRRQRVEQGRRG